MSNTRGRRAMPECPHLNFSADVDVHRFEDQRPMGFMADVRIHCVDCQEPFRFLGLPSGLSFAHPMLSIDGLELHAPIEPELVKTFAASSRFTMPPPPVPKDEPTKP